jgi:hypothetical protein
MCYMQVSLSAPTVLRARGETLLAAQLQTTARIVLWASIEVFLGKLQTPVRSVLLANSACRTVSLRAPAAPLVLGLLLDSRSAHCALLARTTAPPANPNP